MTLESCFYMDGTKTDTYIVLNSCSIHRSHKSTHKCELNTTLEIFKCLQSQFCNIRATGISVPTRYFDPRTSLVWVLPLSLSKLHTHLYIRVFRIVSVALSVQSWQLSKFGGISRGWGTGHIGQINNLANGIATVC